MTVFQSHLKSIANLSVILEYNSFHGNNSSPTRSRRLPARRGNGLSSCHLGCAQTETLEDLLRQALGSFSKASESIFLGEMAITKLLCIGIWARSSISRPCRASNREKRLLSSRLWKRLQRAVSIWKTQKASDGLEFLDTEVMIGVSRCQPLSHHDPLWGVLDVLRQRFT